MVHNVCICEEIISDVAPTSEPTTIQGVRRPKRVRVRSESAPAIGVMVVLNTEVMANRIARLRALLEGSMAWIWLGSSTDNTPQYSASNTKKTVASENSSSQRRPPLTCAGFASFASMTSGGMLIVGLLRRPMGAAAAAAAHASVRRATALRDDARCGARAR